MLRGPCLERKGGPFLSVVYRRETKHWFLLLDLSVLGMGTFTVEVTVTTAFVYPSASILSEINVRPFLALTGRWYVILECVFI